MEAKLKTQEASVEFNGIASLMYVTINAIPRADNGYYDVVFVMQPVGDTCMDVTVKVWNMTSKDARDKLTELGTTLIRMAGNIEDND